MPDTREQCWVIATTAVADHPATPSKLSTLRDEHHAYIANLDEQGILVAHGAARDEAGVRTGTGMIVIRAATRDEAETIARREPYIASGVRILNLLPWQVQFGRVR